LWLLRQPVPLGSSEARSHYRGSIELSSGPERIESGWWDEQDVGRDYYTAVSSRGQKLWIFRDRHSRVWHLHGLFG
jgi:protein ImuB